MDKHGDMQLLVTVVEAGSFAAAARQVDLTPAMVGRRIAALEQQLGFTLLNRSTRQMHLTPGGQSYYDGCKRILEQVEELEESLSSEHQSRPQGLIRLSAPDGLGSPYLVEAIQAFRHLYPEIRFDLNLANTPVDLSAEQLDLVLRLSFDLADSSLVATRLGDTGFSLYASQQYLEARGIPRSIEALEKHDCLSLSNSRYGDYWHLIRDGKPVQLKLPWAVTFDSTENMIHAVVAGLGIALIPDIFAHHHLAAGKLVKLEGIAEFPKPGLYALYPARKHLPWRVRLFLDFLKERSEKYQMG